MDTSPGSRISTYSLMGIKGIVLRAIIVILAYTSTAVLTVLSLIDSRGAA